MRAAGWLAAAVLTVAATAVGAQVGAQAPRVDYAQRYAQVCATCHGADGAGAPFTAPALAGQPGFYAITQLFLFRAGRRGDGPMTAVAKDMTDNDLRGFSDFINGLRPVVPATLQAVDPDRMALGRALAQRHLCTSCHGPDLAGGGQVPRLAGQHEDYLARALHEFRAGRRLGYTNAMGEALSGLGPQDLETLAYFLTRLKGAAQQ